MKKTLYLKFILAYFIFGVFGFIIVTTFVPNMTKEHLIREKAESLYSEATLIAGTYAGGLYTSETTLETVKMQLDSLAVYLIHQPVLVAISLALAFLTGHTFSVG